MNRLISALALLLLLVTSGCSKQRFFKIKGEITGLGAQTVSMLYYAGGGLQRATVYGDGAGGFEIRGESANPTLAVLTLGDGTVLANLVVENGNNLSLKGSLEHPMAIAVKGSGVSSDIAKWQAQNEMLLQSGDAAAINACVKEFVEQNKGSLAATAVLVTHFRIPGNEILADSLMTIIKPDSRPGAVVQNFSSVLAHQISSKTLATVKPMLLSTVTDSAYYFVPTSHTVSLISFLPDKRLCRDSIVPLLRSLRSRYSGKKLVIIEISSSLDSTQWRRSVSADSAKWVQSWAPASVSGAAVRALSVPQVPYFIVTDSAGNQLLRTHSVSIADKLVREKLK